MQVILDQLVYFGFFQSLLLLAIYLFSPGKRKHIHGTMAFLILVLFIGLCGKVLHTAGVWDRNFRLILLSELSALLFGPCIYLFSRFVISRIDFERKDVVHYIPGIAYSLFILIYFVLPSSETLKARTATGETMRVVYICHALGLIVNITYWFLSWRLLQDFMQKMKEELSFELHARFLRNFLILIGLCLFIWAALFLTNFLGYEMMERNARPYIWTILTLIILFITYFGMVSPQVLRMLPEAALPKYSQSKLSRADLDRLKRELDELMIKKKPYLNNKLLKAELAEMLGLSNPELARLLNENIGMNFFEYVNYYRIKEFVELAKEEGAEQFTFFGLAQEAGFNSKSTFNKSFKKLMGVSPSMYFNQIDT
ncbi:MAG: helix-turn-helix domain-containing protein [Bacteroidota bacterium]